MGLHRHPVSTVGVVTAGSFNLQLEGKPARFLKTGDSFFEPAGQTILKFDNASTSEFCIWEIVCFAVGLAVVLVGRIRLLV